MTTVNKKIDPKAIIVKKVITPKTLIKWISLVAVSILVVFVYSYVTSPKPASLTEVVDVVAKKQAKKVIVSDTKVEVITSDNKRLFAPIEQQGSFLELLQREGIKISDLKENNVEVEVKPGGTHILDILNFLANVIFLTLIGYSVLKFVSFLRQQGRGMGGLSMFGRSPAKLILGKRPDTTFKDVAGMYEIKEEIKTIVDFLKNPKKYTKMGARIPKGILLEGPPGTGKTLIARAVAGEAGVPFFYTSGAEFEEMLVGAGAARVRDLFRKARALQPCIIFIDEIDAVAKKRGIDFRSTYSEQTLNQILAEMDGLEKNEAVIVMAATNRADVLDPAIMRPGRFDWRIKFNLPDYKERLEILKYHSRNKPLSEDVDLEQIAKITVGFSGAELESTLNEAAILAVRAGRDKILQEDMLEGMYKVTSGPRRKTMVMTKEDLLATAYHEAGHAIVGVFLEHAPEVQTITVIPRAKSLGVTSFAYEYEKVHRTYAELVDTIAMATAGRAAEELIYGKEYISTGAANDIEKASAIARSMVKHFGMSQKLGFISYGQDAEEYLLISLKKDYSEKTAEVIDEEIRQIVQAQYKRALEILERERILLDKVAEALITRETLTKKEFYDLVKKYAVKKPPKKAAKIVKSVAEWISSTKRKKKL